MPHVLPGRVVDTVVPPLRLAEVPAVRRRRPVQAGEQPVVLLVASANWLGVARFPKLLHRAGCRVVLFASPGILATRSRHVDEIVDVPRTGSLIDALRAHLMQCGERYHWIIPATDVDVLALATRADEPWARELLPLDGTSAEPALLTSKQRFVEALDAAGVPVPRSAPAETMAEAIAAAERIGYPVILKPVAGSAGRGVAKATNAAELVAAWATCSRDGVIVVQRFVDGQVGSAQVVFERGVALCWMTSYKARTWPAPYGPSTMRRFVAIDGMRELLSAVGRVTGLDGLVCIDFMHERSSGAVYFLELNARPSPVMHLYAHARADFPGAIRAMVGDRRRPARMPDGVGAAREVRLFPQDAIRSLIERDYRSIAAWLLPWSWRDVPFGEPRLLRAHLTVIRAGIRPR